MPPQNLSTAYRQPAVENCRRAASVVLGSPRTQRCARTEFYKQIIQKVSHAGFGLAPVGDLRDPGRYQSECEIVDTAFLLMAMYSGRPIIPADEVAKSFFGLTTDKFVRKVSAGDIALPLVRMEASQKCAKGVHLNDLAAYLDERRAAAMKECQKLHGKG